ncbi:MAG: Arc family DNA-binding protein [Thiopseudomonas sp.]|nr:Arc family DNA-binding protein [Thiopseudomonas sp.]
MGVRAVTVRDVPEEVHRAIRVRAAQHGRSLQAEMLAIFEQAVKPEGRVKLGNLLGEIGREVKLTDEEVAGFERDHSPARAANF